MKRIIFDSGPVISMTLNNLLFLVEKLKDKFDGEFILPSSVHTELVSKPLSIKRFKFEAMQVQYYINKGVFKVENLGSLKTRSDYLLNLANHCFYVHKENLSVVQSAEIDAITLCLEEGASAVVMDERTLRLLIENPMELKSVLESRLHTKVHADEVNINKFLSEVKGIKIIRSVELVTIAFELGLLDNYLKIASKTELLDALLWGLKLDGCSVSEKEINEIISIES